VSESAGTAPDDLPASADPRVKSGVGRLREAAQDIESALEDAYETLEDFGCETRIPEDAHKAARRLLTWLRDHARAMVEEAIAEEVDGSTSAHPDAST
jgi:hypothetical protein